MDFTINGKPLSSLRVVDLKVELEKRGLPKSGNKNDLIERLSQYLLKQTQNQDDYNYRCKKFGVSRFATMFWSLCTVNSLQ